MSTKGRILGILVLIGALATSPLAIAQDSSGMVVASRGEVIAMSNGGSRELKQGDYSLKPTIAEFEKFFDLPALEDISPERRAALEADLEINGFRQKSIIVSMFAESGSMAVDQPERIRVAASMGFESIPTTFSFIELDAIMSHCGPGTPTGTSGVSGATTPVSGATVPPGVPVDPPVVPPDDPASPS